VKNQTKLVNFRAVSIGFSAALLALACGSSDKSTDNTDSKGNGATQGSDVAPATVMVPKAETCDDNPLLAGCDANTGKGTPAGNTNAGTGATNTTPAKQQSPADLAKAAAENVLASNCGQCHGSNLTPQTAQAGMNYINDIDKLVSTGKIIPLNAAGSRVVQRMEKGEMPPPSSGLPRVTDADINIVSSFIDNPQFWPDYAGKAADCTATNKAVDFDQVFRDVEDDLRAADIQDRPFFRYISLGNRITAGVCKDALDADRNGMTKMINMLSGDARVRQPVSVNTDETLYRIDLRLLQWDHAISVNGTAFTDIWEAIAGNNQYAVQFTGQDADAAIADAQTNIPFQMSDQMMDVATIGNLYYAIIGVDVNQTLNDFIANTLQINTAQNIIDKQDIIRAGTTKSRISRQDRLVERDEQVIRNGALWQAFDFEAGVANQSIFQNPFNFVAGGTEAIFTLPNGLMAFIIADGQGAIKEDSDILLDTNQNNFRAITSISCSNCHASGFISVTDEVLNVTLPQAREIGLNNDQVEELKAIYVPATEFSAQVTDDTSNFYQRALQQAQLPIQGGDPVSTTWLRFDQDVKLEDAAGDLGVDASQLKDDLDLLNPVVSVLKNGTLDRDDWTNFYVDSLCRETTFTDNVPLAAICDAAAAKAALDSGVAQ
jgi:mono/diheme cytochrome c family protein